MLNRLFQRIGNTKATSRLDEEEGVFSLHNTQLYVGTLYDNDGLPKKAVSLLFGSAVEGPASQVVLYDFTIADATRLVRFLDTVLRNQIPASFRFPASKTFFLLTDGSVVWTVSKYIENWHEGGGYKGALGSRTGQIITKESVENLRACVSKFFAVDI